MLNISDNRAFSDLVILLFDFKKLEVKEEVPCRSILFHLLQETADKLLNLLVLRHLGITFKFYELIVFFFSETFLNSAVHHSFKSRHLIAENPKSMLFDQMHLEIQFSVLVLHSVQLCFDL